MVPYAGEIEMKKLITILGMTILVILSNSVLGEVVVREEPLTWPDVARLDGHEVYDNLCVACHGVSGKGDGPAAVALDKPVRDLTHYSANNNGVYPHKAVQSAIYGRNREVTHGTIDMLTWGQQFKYIRYGWNDFQREAYAQNRVHVLAAHVETMQVVTE